MSPNHEPSTAGSKYRKAINQASLWRAARPAISMFWRGAPATQQTPTAQPAFDRSAAGPAGLPACSWHSARKTNAWHPVFVGLGPRPLIVSWMIFPGKTGPSPRSGLQPCCWPGINVCSGEAGLPACAHGGGPVERNVDDRSGSDPVWTTRSDDHFGASTPKWPSNRPAGDRKRD